MYVENIRKIHQKLVQPLSVICAFKASTSPQQSPRTPPCPLDTLTNPTNPTNPTPYDDIADEEDARSMPVTSSRDTSPATYASHCGDRCDSSGAGLGGKSASMCSLLTGGDQGSKRNGGQRSSSASSYAKHTQSSTCKIRIERTRP